LSLNRSLSRSLARHSLTHLPLCSSVLPKLLLQPCMPAQLHLLLASSQCSALECQPAPEVVCALAEVAACTCYAKVCSAHEHLVRMVVVVVVVVVAGHTWQVSERWRSSVGCFVPQVGLGRDVSNCCSNNSSICLRMILILILSAADRDGINSHQSPGCALARHRCCMG
jgi:hypothetical protein